MLEKRRGFGVLSPKARLVCVFASGCLYLLINNVWVALGFLLLALGIFLSGENRNWKIASSAPFTGVMMFFYNVIFSPKAYEGIQFLIFTINPQGVERGLTTGMRLTGAMLISFAWLLSTPIPEMYEGISWLKPAEPLALAFLRGIQILKREFVVLTQSLLIRGLKWNSTMANIGNLVPLAMAIIPRVIDNSQKTTLANLSHTRRAPSGDGSLVLQEVRVRYSPDLPEVLKGVALAVEQGEFVYVAGRSRAGKTTLLRVAGGVIPWIMGEFRGVVKASGMVTHQTRLVTVSASVRYVAPDPFASLYGLTVAQEMLLLTGESDAKRVLEVMSLGGLWRRETTKLSGGQQVRLVLAGALASQAKILLLDSPMQELDPQGRVEFIAALNEFRRRSGCTVLVADPFWAEIRPFITRAVTLEDGLITQSLEPDQIFGEEGLSHYLLLRHSRKPLSVSAGDVVAEMHDVQVALEGVPILKGVSLDVKEGELIVVMGPNGSGKTTAMLTLAGSIAPIRGSVRVRGRVGYVFQNASLQTISMTVKDELAFGPKIQRWASSDAQRFVERGLAWTGLDALACPLDLHSSDIEMLAIAAANTDVSTLILDEPTIGLDSVGVDMVLDLVEGLVRNGKAVVIITHDPEIARIASRVVIVDGGRVVYDGPAEGSPSTGGVPMR